MQEELVSQKTLDLAWEKGFKVEQYIVYSYIDREEESHHRGLTQGLLQRWLREIHGIYISIIKKKGLGHEFWIRMENLDGDWESVLYRTGSTWKYEEALEEALLESLRLVG